MQAITSAPTIDITRPFVQLPKFLSTDSKLGLTVHRQTLLLVIHHSCRWNYRFPSKFINSNCVCVVL